MPHPFHRNNKHFQFNSHFIRKIGLIIVICFVFLFSLTSLANLAQSKMQSSKVLQKWTTFISEETFLTTLSMEVPKLRSFNDNQGIEVPKTTHILLEMITSFNPQDPRSLIRGELPGFMHFDGQVVVAGQGTNYTDIPIESAPPLEVVLEDRDTSNDQPAYEKDKEPTQPVEADEDELDAKMTTGGRKVVFIYHTHNRESYFPQVPSAKHPNEAYHPVNNITKVGERLGQELEKRGLGSYVDKTDIAQKLKDANKTFSFSYVKSREVMKSILKNQKDVIFQFDLHRDSQPRKYTTTKINGQSYARTYFIIGGRNPKYQKNLQFANVLHKKLEATYPGLSRGIYFKEGGNGEYNQSLSDKNILIEIGGVENSLEEAYRTASALADVIADLYWEAEKVNANVQNSR